MPRIDRCHYYTPVNNCHSDQPSNTFPPVFITYLPSPIIELLPLWGTRVRAENLIITRRQIHTVASFLHHPVFCLEDIKFITLTYLVSG